MATEIPAQSVEYLHGPISASVTLDTQTVDVAFLTKAEDAPDDKTSWSTAAWEGDAGKQRTWRLLIGPGTNNPLGPGTYKVWSRVKDSPEKPVRLHGSLKII